MSSPARMHGHVVGGAMWCAALVCALGAAAVAAAPVVPAVAPAAPVGTNTVPPATPGHGHGNVAQSVRGEHVRIEGKLYSPQALFLVSRRTEAFGRDAVVPNYLTVQPDAAFLPYRLQAEEPPGKATAPVPAPDAASTRASDTRH